MAKPLLINLKKEDIGVLPGGRWPESPDSALVLPLPLDFVVEGEITVEGPVGQLVPSPENLRVASLRLLRGHRLRL